MTTDITDRVAGADWQAVSAEVDDYGCALLPELLTATECAAIDRLYDEPERFRTVRTEHLAGDGFQEVRHGAAVLRKVTLP